MDSVIVRRNTIIQIVIATLAFILIVRIWPYGFVQRHYASEQQAQTSIVEEPFTASDKKLQTVTFAYAHIYQIKLLADCESYEKDAAVIFRLYDENFSAIYEEEYACSRIAADGYLLATPDLAVETDKDYYYEILLPMEAVADIVLSTADRQELSQQENKTLYIDGIINDEKALAADFYYTQKLSAVRIIFYDILIIFLAVLSYMGIVWMSGKYGEAFSYIQPYFRIAVTIVTAVLALALLYLTVIRNVFGGEGWDRAVYALGIAAAVFWILCAVWLEKGKRKPSKLAPARQASLIWRNYIQTVSFGLLFYALCQYVNADREYYHYVNTRWMLIFLGIALLMIYTEKEFCNLLSLIWLVISIAGAIVYCFGYAGEEQEFYLAKLTAGVVVVWGLLVINILMQLKKDFFRKISLPFFGIWMVFNLFMYLFRFEKVWTFTATLPFAVLLFCELSPAKRSRLLKNFTNGILLSFCMVTAFCFRHRPYHFWMRYRYNGIFHTVACTGMYLAVVLGAALGKLYGKIGDAGRIGRRCFKELFFVSSVMAFIIFTMSRTAILTSVVNFALVALLAAFAYKKTPKRMIVETGITIAAIVISFPLMYSAIRMIPALTNEPIRYELEPQERSYMIYEGDLIDSDKYMTIKRFFDVFFGRFQTAGEEESALENTRLEQTLLASLQNDRLPVANIPTAALEERRYELTADSDISNGRFQIFIDYIKALSFEGHAKMSMINENGEEYAHAHNSYIQVAYNFGIVAGILFLALCAYTLWKSIILFIKYGKKYSIYMVPFSLIIVFGFVSLTEWAFHPCIPAGFSFILMQVLLMTDPTEKKRKCEENEIIKSCE